MKDSKFKIINNTKIFIKFIRKIIINYPRLEYVLKDMLKKDLNDEEYKLICKTIDSTNSKYINKIIKKSKNKEIKRNIKRKAEIEEIPNYDYERGLPIGNMTSQFLSIYYLSGLDHKIVHDFKIKNYLRYMDDFIIMSDNKEYLKEVESKIEIILNDIYHLKLNKKKCQIVSLRDGFLFCGYRFRIINKKTIINVSKATKERITKNINNSRYLFSNNKIILSFLFCSILTYYNGFKYGSKLKMRRVINKYF